MYRVLARSYGIQRNNGIGCGQIPVNTLQKGWSNVLELMLEILQMVLLPFIIAVAAGLVVWWMVGHLGTKRDTEDIE